MNWLIFTSSPTSWSEESQAKQTSSTGSQHSSVVNDASMGRIVSVLVNDWLPIETRNVGPPFEKQIVHISRTLWQKLCKGDRVHNLADIIVPSNAARFAIELEPLLDSKETWASSDDQGRQNPEHSIPNWQDSWTCCWHESSSSLGNDQLPWISSLWKFIWRKVLLKILYAVNPIRCWIAGSGLVFLAHVHAYETAAAKEVVMNTECTLLFVNVTNGI